MKFKVTLGPGALLNPLKLYCNSISYPTDIDRHLWQSKCIFITESINTSSMVLFLFTEIAGVFLSKVITLITRRKPTHKYCWTYYASLEQCFTLKLVHFFPPHTHTHILCLRERPNYWKQTSQWWCGRRCKWNGWESVGKRWSGGFPLLILAADYNKPSKRCLSLLMLMTLAILFSWSMLICVLSDSGAWHCWKRARMVSKPSPDKFFFFKRGRERTLSWIKAKSSRLFPSYTAWCLNPTPARQISLEPERYFPELQTLTLHATGPNTLALPSYHDCCRGGLSR